MSKNKNTLRNKRNFFNFLSKHRLASTIVVIAIYIFITLLIFLNSNKSSDTPSPLEHLKLSAEISSSLFIVISSTIAVWQYYVSCRHEQIKNETEKIQKSIELIGYFKDNILNKITVIKYIFDNSNISNILNCIDKTKIKNFDVHELKQLLTEKQINDLKGKKNDDDFLKAIIIANEIFDLNLPDMCINLENTENKSGAGILNNPKTTKVINAFMSNFIIDTLNNLEYFSMYFAHNIADESVIYQSAHQEFIEITELLYYLISINNTTENSKYYTNLIELYNIWKPRQMQRKEIIIEQQRQIDKGKSANPIV